MKRIILFLAMAIPFSGICQPQKFKVKGIVSGVSKKAKAYLVYQLGNQMIQDSCQLKDGVFQFSGNLKFAAEASLLLGHEGVLSPNGKLDVFSIYLENGVILVRGKDSLARCKVSGTPLNAINQERIKLFGGGEQSMSGSRTKEDLEKLTKFADRYPNSQVTLDWMISIGGNDSTVASHYNKLPRTLKATPRGKLLGQETEAFLATRIGRIAPEFTLLDPEGKAIKLSDFKGKYVLIDFWASWCKPCRAVQPKLIQLYNEWKDTGKFTILSISLDKDKAAWKKAIEEDKVFWTQVADLDGSAKIAQQYGVSIIPASFLVDPEGRIISNTGDRELLKNRLVGDSLTITGQFKGLHPLTVALSLNGYTKRIPLKINALNDQFTFKIKKQIQPVLIALQFDLPEKDWIAMKEDALNNSPTVVNLFIYQADLNIDGASPVLSQAKVSGDAINEDYMIMKGIEHADNGENALGAELDHFDPVKDSVAFFNLLRTKGVALSKKKLQLQQEFIKAHPDSFVSLFTLADMEFMYSADGFENAYNQLTSKYKGTKEAALIRNRNETLKITKTGKQAVDFSRKNQFDKQVKLSDYRGKVVLLDFWGSWCKPCRETHPHLKELYKAYKSKGFEIVAVAIEHSKVISENKAAWLAAIHKDEINWVHVLNNEGTADQDIAKAYGVTQYPTKILLDKDGKILMRITSGLNDEMDQVIKDLTQ